MRRGVGDSEVAQAVQTPEPFGIVHRFSARTRKSETMSLFRSDVGKSRPPEEWRDPERRSLGRLGSAAIPLAVALVVIGWIGVLGWALKWLLGW